MNFNVEYLKEKISCLLMAHGLEQNQAVVTADCFVTADACGVKTHGLSVLRAHINKIDKGFYNLNPNIRIEKSTHAFAVVNSDNSIGPFSADFCMKLAVENAKKEGIYTVFSNNCNTYGPAFYYTKLAADEGLIGITCCNTPAAMAPWGSYEKLIGTNPFAAGIPGKKSGPVLLDFATSKVAKSKINQARLSGNQIPQDWALDINGNKTTDPLEAIKGVVLPMADYKGYGIALVIDMLSGVLSGAAYADGVNKFYSEDGKPMNVGQLFVAIDPQIIANDEFYSHVDEYIDKIHMCKSADGIAPLYPGERKNINYEKALLSGIEYSDSEAENIETLLKEIQ